MKQSFTLLLVLCMLVDVTAFVAPKTPSVPAISVATYTTTTAPKHLSYRLEAIKKKNDIEVKQSFQFQLEWLLPTKNPYMLIVYPILFIFVADFFHLAPNSTP